MMKHLYFFLAVSLISSSVVGQSALWTDHQESIAHLENSAEATIIPTKRRVFDIDYNALRDELANKAPDEYSGQSGHVISLPMPDGSVESFRMYYSPSYEAELQEQFPMIRSYKGFGVQHKRWNVRLTISQLGVKGSVYTPKGEIYIDPVVHGQTDVHAIYYVRDYPEEVHEQAVFRCGSHDPDHSPLAHLNPDDLPESNMLRGAGEAVPLKTFRLAVATSGEWTTRYGGKDDALARVIASTDRLNQVYENDIGARLILVGNNASVIYEDPQLDPYPGGSRKAGRDIIGTNTTWLNRDIGAANYDIGHVFLRGCSDVGGVAALGSLCQNNKGNGVTCWYLDNLDYIVVRVWCHEIGHQFAAPHTFNFCGGSNESLASGFEPGSGSTIMSYGGLCGSNNVVGGGAANRDITYFHAHSVNTMFRYSRNLSCGNEIPTSNTRPEATMEYQDGFTIPVRTPFALEGEGMDLEADDLTFCFEQLDAASKNCPLGSPEDNCPAFRSIPPRPENYRVFPTFSSILSNRTFSDPNEVLVDYTREFNFILTVRDNNPEAGGYGMDTVTFYTDENSGPFEVTFPNAGEEQVAGDIIEISWDVANTNQAPVNCRAVDIVLQTGSNWGDYTVLKSGTDNDGTEWVRLPDMEMNNVRILIMAAENIFFDISNQAFDIKSPGSESYNWGLEPNYGRVCLPSTFSTDIFSSAIGGYEGNITFDIVSGLPNGATFDFAQSTVEASQGTTLNIDLTNVMGKQDAVIEIQGVTDTGDTLRRNLVLEILSNDYSGLVTVEPLNSAQGIGQNPVFTWQGIIDADYYDFQLATSPSYDANSMVQEDYNLTGTSIILNDILDRNTIYYWRVRGGNICGLGEWTTPSAFSTESSSCKNYVSQDVGVSVPKNAITEFNLTIDVDATINDLNVDNFVFFCDQLQDATMWLESPQGTEVLLARSQCGNQTQYECRFDDIGGRLRCPPIDNRTFKPQGDITRFNGENAKGKWILRFDISNQARRATLDIWELEVCVNQSLDAPYLVRNDTMKMRPSENSPIKNAILLTNDDNNSASELTYTLLSTPDKGEVLLSGTVLGQGGTFTQEDLNNERVTYNQTSGQNDVDQFIFNVQDDAGGWTGLHTFVIEANEDFPSSTGDLIQRELFAIFPNPTSGVIQIQFLENLSEDVQVEVHNLQGQVLKTRDVAKSTESISLDLSTWAKGVYLIKTQIGPYFYVEKVTLNN